jgi:hypothetical protein
MRLDMNTRMWEDMLGRPGTRRERVRHALISALLVFAIACIVAQLVFESQLQKDVNKVAIPFVSTFGLDQNWGVFAPDPRANTIAMRARIEYADGTAEWWNVPYSGALIGEYWDYRWRKWLEYIINPGFRPILFRPLALWIANNHDDFGHRPVRITFVADWDDLNSPGQNPFTSDKHETAYYTLAITPGMLRRS